MDVEASETAEGERHIVCIICGEELMRETIPKIPESGLETGTVIVIAAGSAVGFAGCSSLVVWLILRKRRKI